MDEQPRNEYTAAFRRSTLLPGGNSPEDGSRLRIAPNASLPIHDRPVRVVIPLTTNAVRISHPDVTTSVTREELIAKVPVR